VGTREMPSNYGIGRGSAKVMKELLVVNRTGAHTERSFGNGGIDEGKL